MTQDNETSFGIERKDDKEKRSLLNDFMCDGEE